jgi:xanthine dehydrogenase molybdopterin-binding subunit B
VGEPPLLLPFSVFFAIRDAVAAVADYRVAPPLRAPATSERILKAIAAVKAAERTPNASEPHHDRPAQHPASAKELIVS